MLKVFRGILILTAICAGASKAFAIGKASLLSEFFLSSDYHQKADSPINSTNRVLETPTSYSVVEYRPDFSYTTETLKSVVRSRLMVDEKYTEYTTPSVQTSALQGRTDLSDAFVQWTPSDRYSYTLGLQNYQWGPAELFSPSNPFFHFNSHQKTFFYKEKGRALLRMNLALTDQLSFLTMAEPISNNEPNWIAEHDFYPKAIAKIEFQFANRTDYVAFLGGSGEQGHLFIGQYGNYSLSDGVSIYADIKEEDGISQFEPKRGADGVDDLAYKDSNKDWFSMILGGLRYELPSVDIREEILYSASGYDSDQWKRVQQLIVTPTLNLAKNISRFARPGIEFVTQWYSYTSVRIPDLGKKKDANLYFRYLHGATDGSGVFQFDADKAWGSASTVYFEGLIYQGARGSEYHFADDYQISIGAKISI